jgi:hypothetical protein
MAGPVDIGGTAVPLQLERVDPVRRRELWNDRAHRRNVHVGPVQDDQRVAITGNLVIHLHAIDLDALANRLRLGLGRRSSVQQQDRGEECSAERVTCVM